MTREEYLEAENLILDQIEKEDQKENREFLLSLLALMATVDGIQSFLQFRGGLESQARSLAKDKIDKLKSLIADEVSKSTGMNAKKYVDEAFSRIYTKEGTNLKYTLEDIIHEATQSVAQKVEQGLMGQKFKTNTTQSRKILKKALDTSKRLSNIISNEVHKARENAKIDEALKGNAQEFDYITAGDNRVRDKHAQASGKHPMSEVETYRGYLSEINCRCTIFFGI
jgi:hypothetical protein